MNKNTYHELKTKVQQFENIENDIKRVEETLKQSSNNGESFIIESFYGNGSSNVKCSISKISPYFTKVQELLRLQVEWMRDNQNKI